MSKCFAAIFMTKLTWLTKIYVCVCVCDIFVYVCDTQFFLFDSDEYTEELEMSEYTSLPQQKWVVELLFKLNVVSV